MENLKYMQKIEVAQAKKKIVMNNPSYNNLFICYFYLKHIKAVGAKKIEKTK